MYPFISEDRIMIAARRPLVVVAVLGFVALAASASAQQGGVSAIAGIVRDTSGAVLPGATVQAASPVLIERVREVVTDEQGQYKIVNLPLGTYSVTVSLPGFRGVQRSGIELTTNFTAPVNADMLNMPVVSCRWESRRSGRPLRIVKGLS